MVVLNSILKYIEMTKAQLGLQQGDISWNK